MTIKVFRIVEATEKGDNLLGYGFADEKVSVAVVGSKVIYYRNTFRVEDGKLIEDLGWDGLLQEQTDDIRGYRVEYQEYDLGDTPFV